MRPFRLTAGKEIVRQGLIELAEGEPDFWAFVDLASLAGREVSIEVEGLPYGSLALERLEVLDDLKGTGPVYHEPGRPLFHFTPRRGWINDPNGLVHYQGEYHLFYQHNPYGLESAWGGLGWGHAVSTDLVHWRERDEALFPDEFGSMCSGTAVVDPANTSGLGEGGRAPLLLFYTAAREEAFVLGMASSTDGRSFRKYPGNPVVPQIRWGNRDPKVFWHEETRRWVMAVYVPGQPEPWARDDANRPFFRYEIHFLTSANLREWKPESVFPGGMGNDFESVDPFLFECVDLFPMPVGGDPGRRKWIIMGANGGHAIGEFDGKKFIAESGGKSAGHPGIFYAGQTFNDEPGNRRIQMGFLRAPTPGMPFNQCLSVPMELSLRSTPDGWRLGWLPVPELNALRRGSRVVPAGPLHPGQNPLQDFHGPSLDMEIEIEPGEARWIVFGCNGTSLTYDVRTAELICRGVKVPVRLDGKGRLGLRLLLDRTSLEVFAENGLVYFPTALTFSSVPEPPALTAVGGTALIHRLVLHEMASAWGLPAAGGPSPVR